MTWCVVIVYVPTLATIVLGCRLFLRLVDRRTRRHQHPRRGQPAPQSVPQRFQWATGHPLAHIWKREFQDRGAPHLHLYGWRPRRIGDL